ncbi:Crp/Fnr family transcriptional regulator [Thiomonas sp.]
MACQPILCGGCGQRERCRVLELGCSLPGADAIRITQEEFRADAFIPASQGCLLAVKSGAVKTVCRDRLHQARVVDFSFPGDWIGLERLTEDPEQAPVDYLASVSMTTICRIGFDRAAAERLSAGFCECLSTELARRIRANFEYRQIVLQEAPVRVAHYLLRLLRARQEWDGTASPVLPAIARADMASYLQLRVETVSRLLTRFRRNGWVRGPLHRLEVADADALAALVRSAEPPQHRHRGALHG